LKFIPQNGVATRFKCAETLTMTLLHIY